MNESLEALTARHLPTLEAAIDAVNSRKSWSPFRDSPSASRFRIVQHRCPASAKAEAHAA